MFNFLFRRKADATVEAVAETQRETLERALGEVNAIVALMDPKPAVTIDPATGAVTYALPEQFPDEALALPAPEAETPDTSKDAASTASPEAEKEPAAS